MAIHDSKFEVNEWTRLCKPWTDKTDDMRQYDKAYKKLIVGLHLQ